MDRGVGRLIRTMERVAALYAELLECSEAKTTHLVNCDVEAIEAAQAREEMVVGKLAQLEQNRNQVLAETGEALGVTTEPVTLSAVILTLGGEDEAEDRDRLSAIRAELLDVSRRLAASNRLNEQLCTQSLMHLDSFMGLLTGRTSKPSGYDNRGRAQGYHARALVTRSA
jgi:flagellar biosynthesis/type III secretory pathway chaperone